MSLEVALRSIGICNDLNEKCLLLTQIVEHLVPRWWSHLGRAWEVQFCWTKYATGVWSSQPHPTSSSPSCPTPATCRHSSPTIPAEELEAKISSFSKLQWSWCFIIATESYQSTDMNISPFISTFILAALYGLQCTSLFSSIAKLIPILLILKLFYPQFECLFSFNCSG